MAETLAGTVDDEFVRRDAPTPTFTPRGRSAATKRTRRGLVETALSALDERRGFVLLPFAMIGGLVASACLPVEPPLLALGTGTALVAIGLVASGRSLVWARAMVA